MRFWTDILQKWQKKQVNSNTLQLKLKDCFDTKSGEKIKFSEELYDIVQNREIGKSKVEITRRFIDNGDIFIYFEVTKLEDIIIEIDFNKSLIAKDFEEMYKKPEFDNRYGENKVTGPAYYISSSKESAIISKVYYHKELKTKYNEEESSNLYELKLEDNSVKVEKEKIIINLENKGPKCSFFICISKRKIFEDELNRDNYFEFYFKNLHNNFVSSSFFVQKSGTYTKLPYSIEPFTKDGYGYSLHHSSKKELITFLKDTQERYFYNMIMNAIMQAFLYQKQESGVFYTPYTSTWLKKDTGIIAPYIDTRLNETFNLMIKDFIKLTSNKAIKDNTSNYMDFIVNYEINGGDIYKEGEGKFFPDYFRYNLQTKTHASLNHQLGIANGMFEMYRESKDEKYLNLFFAIIKFIENTQAYWIKENGDLFYGIKEENKELIYYGNDYVYVTLIDLLITQKNILSVSNKINRTIEELIISKISYLDKAGYSIFDEQAKFAPGEPIESRAQALKLYKELNLPVKES